MQACQPANVKNLELIIFIVLIIYSFEHHMLRLPITTPIRVKRSWKKRSTWQSTCFLAKIHAEKTPRKDIWFAVLLCFVVVCIKRL